MRSLMKPARGGSSRSRGCQRPGEQSPPASCIGPPVRPGPLLVGIVGVARLGAVMNSSTTKCLPKLLSSSSILAAEVEERSPPTGSDFSGLSTEGFQASNAVKSASAMALHTSGGHAARASVLKSPTSPFFLTGDMCTRWHSTTGPSEKPSELNKGKFGFGAGEP